ncbi:MAG: lysostaphin resistance A-like protein [Candidatus Sulfotelmatobacter sp.]
MWVVLMLFSENPRRPPTSILVGCLLALPFAPVWEEIAWRAFALRRLQRRYSRLLSALILGVYWALWHVPLWLLTLNYLTPILLLIICANLISWSVIFSYLYDRSGQSLPVTILLHSTILTVQNLVFFAVMRGTVFIIPIAAALSVCLAIILAGRLRSTYSFASASVQDSS